MKRLYFIAAYDNLKKVKQKGITMKYTFKLLIMLLIVVLLAGSGLAAEQDNAEPNRGWQYGGSTTDWNSQLSIGYLPSANLQSIPVDASITEYRVRLLRNIQINGDWKLSVGGGYGLKYIDASPLAALPKDLHALLLEVGVNYRINHRSFASLRLYPGIYSDFQSLSSNDVRMPVMALGGYSFDNGLSVIGGFIYRFGYHSSNFIPALGFSYQPNQSWRFDAVAPRPSITYSASQKIQLFAAGDFASDEYELHESKLGAKAIKYSDYKAMAGLNYLPKPAIKISASAGYAFERKFSFYDSVRAGMRVDDVPFFKVSLDYGW